VQYIDGYADPISAAYLTRPLVVVRRFRRSGHAGTSTTAVTRSASSFPAAGSRQGQSGGSRQLGAFSADVGQSVELGTAQAPPPKVGLGQDRPDEAARCGFGRCVLYPLKRLWG
jgi:type IV secretory pathway TrbL component